MSKNAFDNLLASLGEDTDRQALSGLAEKYPVLKESVMLRSDYSRKQDELKARTQLADAWDKWRQENWVENAYGDGTGGLKRELEKDARIQELEKQIEAGGDMDLNTLNAHLDKFLGERGLVTQDVLKKEASTVDQRVNQLFAGYAQVATKGVKLGIRHFARHNEELDVDKLVEFAAEKGYTDLEQAYNTFSADKEQALLQKQREAELEKVRAEEREKVTKELAANRPNAMPVDDGGAEMGHFERKIRGIKETNDPATDDLPALGRGAIAHKAAREL